MMRYIYIPQKFSYQHADIRTVHYHKLIVVIQRFFRWQLGRLWQETVVTSRPGNRVTFLISKTQMLALSEVFLVVLLEDITDISLGRLLPVRRLCMNTTWTVAMLQVTYQSHDLLPSRWLIRLFNIEYMEHDNQVIIKCIICWHFGLKSFVYENPQRRWLTNSHMLNVCCRCHVLLVKQCT